MSGAGEYVEKLLRDMENLVCKGGLVADGSSGFAAFCKLRGFWGGLADGFDSARTRSS